MTADTAPELKRIPLVCICCGKQTHAWKLQREIDKMHRSPLDNAYMHVCASHFQAVPAAAPLPHQPRQADPERTTHHRRGTGQRAALSAGRIR